MTILRAIEGEKHHDRRLPFAQEPGDLVRDIAASPTFGPSPHGIAVNFAPNEVRLPPLHLFNVAAQLLRQQ